MSTFALAWPLVGWAMAGNWTQRDVGASSESFRGKRARIYLMNFLKL